jgi:CheY-like chemotaxis protein
LREVDRRKDIFLATLAHELRNPLGPIRYAVEMLQRLDPYVPKIQENARQIIIRQTNHMVRLVDDLLDVSRITRGTITLREEPVELKAFIDGAIETTAPILEERRHSLTLDLPPEPIWVSGDPIRLAQVIGNLLHNAAKFTPPGGRMSVVAQRIGNGVRISVADNGIGIAADSVGPIFNLFSQAGHATDRVQDGLGIGLSLVKIFVELHHGSVAAISPGLGLGSTFEVWLPLLDSGAGTTSDAAPVQESIGSRRVLVVDDNQDTAYLVGAMLELDGHTVQIRFNGSDAIACASVFQPEIVLLDVGLPDMTGYAVAMQMRQLIGLGNVILIALTGYGTVMDRTRSTEAGFDRHVVKPINSTKLGELMRTQKDRRPH